MGKGLKLRVGKFWGLITTFVEVAAEKLIGRNFLLPPSWIGLRWLKFYFKKSTVCIKVELSRLFSWLHISASPWIYWSTWIGVLGLAKLDSRMKSPLAFVGMCDAQKRVFFTIVCDLFRKLILENIIWLTICSFQELCNSLLICPWNLLIKQFYIKRVTIGQCYTNPKQFLLFWI